MFYTASEMCGHTTSCCDYGECRMPVTASGGLITLCMFLNYKSLQEKKTIYETVVVSATVVLFNSLAFLVKKNTPMLSI